MIKKIEAQAAEREVPVPVGKTARELRDDGWAVSLDIPDRSVLVARDPDEAYEDSLEVEGPTGYNWAIEPTDLLWHLAWEWEVLLKTGLYEDRLEFLREQVERLSAAYRDMRNETTERGFTAYAFLCAAQEDVLSVFKADVEEAIRVRDEHARISRGET